MKKEKQRKMKNNEKGKTMKKEETMKKEKQPKRKNSEKGKTMKKEKQ